MYRDVDNLIIQVFKGHVYILRRSWRLSACSACSQVPRLWIPQGRPSLTKTNTWAAVDIYDVPPTSPAGDPLKNAAGDPLKSQQMACRRNQ